MRYRLLGQTGLRVSNLVLGTANFGTGWGHGTERAEARRIYDAYRQAGGNFVDTADQYQFGQSESLLGEFIAADRADIVLATKYSLGDRAAAGLQHTGNSRKAMVQSVEASLRRLGTDRIDLLWVHMPDGVTPMDEMLRGLDDLVRSGKILYIGLSDFPAWRVSAAAVLARWRGWAPVSAIQVEYSLIERSAERELLPMAAAFDIGVLGWSPLAGGLLTGKYRQGETGRAQKLGAVIHHEDDARKTAIVDTLLAVAREIDRQPGEVALSWVLSRGVLPLVGPRSADHLAASLAAAALQLSAGHLGRLTAASAITLGFPHDMVARSAGALAGGLQSAIELPARPVW